MYLTRMPCSFQKIQAIYSPKLYRTVYQGLKLYLSTFSAQKPEFSVLSQNCCHSHQINYLVAFSLSHFIWEAVSGSLLAHVGAHFTLN